MTEAGRTVLEVQGADGEWMGVSLDAGSFEFDEVQFPRPEEPHRDLIPPRQTFTAEFEVQGQAFGRSLRDLIARAEREALAERIRRRAWLRHPYRSPGVRHGVG